MTTRLKKLGVGLTAAGALAVAYIGGKEGMRTVAYRDVVGIPTVCFGETRGVHMGDSYTADQCRAMLGDALAEFEQGMRKCLTTPDAIPDRPYVAFLSLTYNIGVGSFCRSTAARRLNDGNLRGACEAILAFDRAGGRVIRGLQVRRQEERNMCMEGLRS